MNVTDIDPQYQPVQVLYCVSHEQTVTIALIRCRACSQACMLHVITPALQTEHCGPRHAIVIACWFLLCDFVMVPDVHGLVWSTCVISFSTVVGWGPTHQV
jgi:hypothetical protein